MLAVKAGWFAVYPVKSYVKWSFGIWENWPIKRDGRLTEDRSSREHYVGALWRFKRVKLNVLAVVDTFMYVLCSVYLGIILSVAKRFRSRLTGVFFFSPGLSIVLDLHTERDRVRLG